MSVSVFQRTKMIGTDRPIHVPASGALSIAQDTVVRVHSVFRQPGGVANQVPYASPPLLRRDAASSPVIRASGMFSNRRGGRHSGV